MRSKQVSLGVGERYPCEPVRHARIMLGTLVPSHWLTEGIIPRSGMADNSAYCEEWTYILLMCLYTIRAVTATHRLWSDAV